jgi:hypothetical protein
LQLDGIVHAPSHGPAILKEGGFGILHPAVCAGVIEIKTTVSNISEFEGRLQTIYQRYLGHLTKGHVIGIVVADRNPAKTSEIPTPPTTDRGTHFYHNYRSSSRCPIFILFQETEDGDYLPFNPGIEGMIIAVHRNLLPGSKYM